ncbi:hypothetical protein HYDPIDRAFT_29073 [Hydnomerulius pinastri MD-312]|uniref:Uncharacterized protein n=1 Tax=Hydnomerulius pinastri MD-312 TaxID=994086 RepID=A0A0C9WE93_9AGAM|nr:hypothetical protein HYDPIDRAFT_29073 [Hydnomerulius pinastri MD-312]
MLKWHLSHALATALQNYFTSAFLSPATNVPHEFKQELRDMVDVLRRAYRNKVGVTWDAESYAEDLGKHNTGQNAHLEAQLITKYPPLDIQPHLAHSASTSTAILTSPMVVTNCKDQILVWYLPQILSTSQQARTEHVEILSLTES